MNDATSTTPPPLTLTYEEASEVVGLGVRTLKRHVADGSLRAVHVGRTVRFRYSDLTDFLEAHARGGAPASKRRNGSARRTT